ncbi:MAG: tetratricopeptide repeat protein [Xenococcaceae cyanobacterium]
MSAPRIFICYTRKDNEGDNQSKRWLDCLLEYLKPLNFQEQVRIWSDQDIEIGSSWHDDIQTTLQETLAAVLLVSPSFLASEYIRNSELPVLLKNASDKGVVILPIILRQCLWRETFFKYPDPHNGPEQLSLASFQAANADPLNSLEEHEQDEVLYKVAERILNIVNPNHPRSGGKRTRLSTPHNIPRSGVIKFVGRSEALSRLHQQLGRSQRIAITAIAGMGGVGKTELALQYAQYHCQQQTYPGGVCWLQARRDDLPTQIVNFGRSQLDLNPPEDLDLATQVDYCWRNWKEGEVLVVLDDVTDYQQIKPYLPPNEPRFKILITTRLKKLGKSFQELYLKVLEPLAALELLDSLIGGEGIFCELEGKKDIPSSLCEWLGYLPLGLELVGRYLAEREDLSLEEMQARLKKKRLSQLALTNPDADMTAQLGVKGAFELSWERLNQSTQKLACLLSLFALAPIPWSQVELCLPEEDLEYLDDIRSRFLLKLSLLQRTDEGHYQLHQLIREFLREKLEESAWINDLKRNFCQAMVAVASEIPETPTRKQIEAVSADIPHLAEAVTAYTDWFRDESLIWPFVGLGRFYDGQGVYDLAVPWYEQCLSTIRSRLGEEHSDVAFSLNSLALLYSSQGRYSEAEPLLMQALELYKRLHSEEHPDVASSLNNLAYLYFSQGRYSEAEPLLMQALELYKRLLGQEHPDVALSLNNLAKLYSSQGKYSEAEPLLMQALELYKRLLGQEHPHVAISLNNLAKLYSSQGKYSEAEPLLMQALELRKRLLGEEHPHVAQSLNDLALLYFSQGKYSEAEPLLMQALELRKRLLGEEHPHVAQSLNDLALLYSSQGRYSEAEPLLMQALELRKCLLGQEHPDVAQSLNNLAALYNSQGRYSEAEPLFQQALEIAEKQLGSNHPNTVTFRRNLELLRDRTK